MKKLIVLVVAILVIWAIIKLLGGTSFVSSNSSTAEEHNNWKGTYEVTTENNTLRDIIGSPLPKTASNIHSQAYFYMSSGDKCNWVVASIPKEDFYDLVEELELTRKPNLLELWPEAFDCQIQEFNKFWDVTNIVNKDTYFGEDTDFEACVMFKYENGKLYVKKITRYITSTNKNGMVVHKKAEKNKQL